MNRTLQPEIQELVQFNILPPVRTVMPNGVPLTIINAGEQDVVRRHYLPIACYVKDPENIQRRR